MPRKKKGRQQKQKRLIIGSEADNGGCGTSDPLMIEADKADHSCSGVAGASEEGGAAAASAASAAADEDQQEGDGSLPFEEEIDEIEFSDSCWDEIREEALLFPPPIEPREQYIANLRPLEYYREMAKKQNLICEYFYKMSMKRTLRMYKSLKAEGKMVPDDLDEHINKIKELMHSDGCPSARPPFPMDLLEFFFFPPGFSSCPYRRLMPVRNRYTGQVIPYARCEYSAGVHWLGNDVRDEYFLNLHDELKSTLEKIPPKSFSTKGDRLKLMKQMEERGRDYLGKLSSSDIVLALNRVREYFWLVNLAEERCRIKSILWCQYAKNRRHKDDASERKLFSIEKGLRSRLKILLPCQSWKNVPKKIRSDPEKLAAIIKDELELTRENIATISKIECADYIRYKIDLAMDLRIWKVGNLGDLYNKLLDDKKFKKFLDGQVSDDEELE